MEITPDVSLILVQFIVVGLIGIVTTGIWIWMLIDCIVNEPNAGSHKIIWVLVIVFLNLLGALIYLFARRPQRIRRYGR